MLDILAAIAVSPFSDGSLYTKASTIANGAGAEQQRIWQLCEALTFNDGLLESDGNTGDARGWRLRMHAMVSTISEMQLQKVARVVAEHWHINLDVDD